MRTVNVVRIFNVQKTSFVRYDIIFELISLCRVAALQKSHCKNLKQVCITVLQNAKTKQLRSILREV